MIRSKNPRPPGKLGLPVLGQVFPFMKNPFQFIEDQITDYGPVFKARLGRKAVVMAGPDACAKFIDPSLVQRAGALRTQELQNTLRYAPQGGGPATGHRCAALDYSTLLMEVFTLTLVRHSWRLKDVNPDYDWSLNPPQPVDGLPARVI